MQFMLDVACHQDHGPVSLKDVASRQAISEKYLWQVLAPLKAAGLVTSTRGPHGGYVLARPAKAISVREIIATLEGGFLLVDCTQAPDAGAAYAAQEMWQEVEGRLAEILDGITLEDLAEKQKAAEQQNVMTYSI